MSRFAALVFSLLIPLAHAAIPSVLQRPISLDTAQGPLRGSLLLPRSDAPVPVVLFISGSGPTDRDGNNPEAGRNDGLKKLAIELSRRGIASVRYDKRGVAASRDLAPDERQLSVEAYVADARAWAARLAADHRFGPLILLGHSEGALIATLAAPDAQARGVISIAGTGRPVDQVLREQLAGHLPAPLEARSEALIESLRAGQVDNAVPKKLQVVFRPSVQPYLISLFRQDPAAAFGRLEIPALIVQGRNDIQVGVGDAERLHAAKPDAQVSIIDGMNHVMRIVPPDPQRQRDSYRDPGLPLSTQLVERVAEFVQQVAAG